MTKRILSILFLSIVLAGCTTVYSLKTDNAVIKFASISADSIMVFSTSDAGKPYHILGEIVVMSDEDNEHVISSMRKEASNLGADAIVNLRFDFGYGEWDRGLKGTGTAVKFK